MPSPSQALVDQIFDQADALMARDYISLLTGSEDPEDFRKYFELRLKQQGKDTGQAGAVMHFTFDLTGTGEVKMEARPAPEVVDVESRTVPSTADDPRPAEPDRLPPPEVVEEFLEFNIGELLER